MHRRLFSQLIIVCRIEPILYHTVFLAFRPEDTPQCRDKRAARLESALHEKGPEFCHKYIKRVRFHNIDIPRPANFTPVPVHRVSGDLRFLDGPRTHFLEEAARPAALVTYVGFPARLGPGWSCFSARTSDTRSAMGHTTPRRFSSLFAYGVHAWAPSY